MPTYTPKEITPKILELCDEIIPNSIPVWIPVKAMKGGVINDCFPNVQSKIKQSGGTIQYGWCIWEWLKTIVTRIVTKLT